MAISWEKVAFIAWDECCMNCAVKRGWKQDILKHPYPFNCVHREDLEGKQRVCAGWKKKLEEWKC